MTDEMMQAGKIATDSAPDPMPRRALDWSLRVWRPPARVAIALALLLTWHVFNTKNGVTVWYQKRAKTGSCSGRSMTWNRRTRDCASRSSGSSRTPMRLSRQRAKGCTTPNRASDLRATRETKTQPAGAGK